MLTAAAKERVCRHGLAANWAGLMMSWSFIFEWGVLALIVAYLAASVWGQYRLGRAQRRKYERECPRRAFDGSMISPQIEQLRRNYLAATYQRPHQAYHRKAELTAAKHAVLEFSYFRGRQTSPASRAIQGEEDSTQNP